MVSWRILSRSFEKLNCKIESIKNEELVVVKKKLGKNK